MRKFNTIKKSRKKSKDIDEKIEYLNKECQKTGLNEITMSTSGIYSVLGKEENPAHTTFTDATGNGQPFAMTSTNGLSIGGATTDENGFSFAPDGSGPATSYRGIASGFQPSKPGFQRSPQHRKIGAFLWYWNGSNYARLEWKFDNQNVSNAGQWAQWKQGAFTPFLDPIIGDASFDSSLLAAIISAGGGGTFPDPDNITPPNNPVLFKNDLGDSKFVPVDIMSPEAYKTLLFASDYYSPEDKKNVINYFKKKQADPTYQPKPFELESLRRQMRAQGDDGTQVAFFGGGNKPKPKPTRRTNRGTLDARYAPLNMGGMTPEKFFQKYGMTPNEYLNLPAN